MLMPGSPTFKTLVAEQSANKQRNFRTPEFQVNGSNDMASKARAIIATKYAVAACDISLNLLTTPELALGLI